MKPVFRLHPDTDDGKHGVEELYFGMCSDIEQRHLSRLLDTCHWMDEDEMCKDVFGAYTCTLQSLHYQYYHACTDEKGRLVAVWKRY